MISIYFHNFLNLPTRLLKLCFSTLNLSKHDVQSRSAVFLTLTLISHFRPIYFRRLSVFTFKPILNQFYFLNNSDCMTSAFFVNEPGKSLIT